MKKSTILLEKGVITNILAMPTAEKSFLQKESAAIEGVKIFDTDDFYNHDVKRNSTPDVMDVYLIGAFFVALYEAGEWQRQFPDDRVVLLTNLWYRPITDAVNFDYAVNVSAFRINKISESRGETIPISTAKDWVASASKAWPKLGAEVIVLDDDQFLSDLVEFKS